MPVWHWLCQKVTQGWPKAQGMCTALTWPGFLSPLTLCHLTSWHVALCAGETPVHHPSTLHSPKELQWVTCNARNLPTPSHRMEVFTELCFLNYSLQPEGVIEKLFKITETAFCKPSRWIPDCNIPVLLIWTLKINKMSTSCRKSLCVQNTPLCKMVKWS